MKLTTKWTPKDLDCTCIDHNGWVYRCKWKWMEIQSLWYVDSVLCKWSVYGPWVLNYSRSQIICNIHDKRLKKNNMTFEWFGMQHWPQTMNGIEFICLLNHCISIAVLTQWWFSILSISFVSCDLQYLFFFFSEETMK